MTTFNSTVALDAEIDGPDKAVLVQSRSSLRLLSQIFVAFFVRGFGASSAFLMSVFVSRSLDASDAGLFFIALTVVSTFGRLVSFGAPNSVLRLVGAHGFTDWPRINLNLSAILRIGVQLTVGVFVLAVLFATPIATYIFEKPAMAGILPVTGACVGLLALLQILSAAIQGKHQAGRASFVLNSIHPIVVIVWIVGAGYAGVPLTSAALVNSFCVGLSIALLVACYFWFRDERAKWLTKASVDDVYRASLLETFPIVVMMVAIQWSGSLATSTLLSSTDVAFFSTAQQTSMVASFLLIGVNLVVAPKFSSAFAAGNLSQLRKLSLLSNRIMLMVSAPIISGMLLFPGFVMSAFGAQYSAAAPLLQILTVGQFVNLMTGSVSYLLMMTGHEKDLRNLTLLSGPVLVFVTVLLTVYLGVLGAAIGTALGVSCQNLFAVWVVRKRLGFNTLNIIK